MSGSVSIGAKIATIVARLQDAWATIASQILAERSARPRIFSKLSRMSWRTITLGEAGVGEDTDAVGFGSAPGAGTVELRMFGADLPPGFGLGSGEPDSFTTDFKLFDFPGGMFVRIEARQGVCWQDDEIFARHARSSKLRLRAKPVLPPPKDQSGNQDVRSCSKAHGSAPHAKGGARRDKGRLGSEERLA